MCQRTQTIIRGHRRRAQAQPFPKSRETAVSSFIDPYPLHKVYEGLHVLDLSQGIA